MPNKTALVLEPLILGIFLILIFSFFKKFKIKSPTLSFQTPVKISVSNPNLEHPTAIFKGEPPTKASKPFISSNFEPIF